VSEKGSVRWIEKSDGGGVLGYSLVSLGSGSKRFLERLTNRTGRSIHFAGTYTRAGMGFHKAPSRSSAFLPNARPKCVYRLCHRLQEWEFAQSSVADGLLALRSVRHSHRYDFIAVPPIDPEVAFQCEHLAVPA
jgi:hypothetical protein